MGESILRDRKILFESVLPRLDRLSKGNQVNIPEPESVIFSGNTIEIEDAGKSPRKSSLFFLTVLIDLGIELIGDKVY